MGKKATAFALAALLVLGLSGCGSNRSSNTDSSTGTRSTYGTNDAYNNGVNGNNGILGNDGSFENGSERNNSNNSNNNGSSNGRGRGLMNDIGDGIGNAMDDAGDAIRDAGDAMSGDSRRFQEMLENGRVHDSDGFLFDGENRHD